MEELKHDVGKNVILEKFMSQTGWTLKRLSNTLTGCQHSRRSSLLLKSESVRIFLLRMWRASAALLVTRWKSLGGGRPLQRRKLWRRTYQRFHNTVLQHRVTMETRLGGDIYGGVWQVRGANGGASCTKLCVESHKTFTHCCDELPTVYRGGNAVQLTTVSVLWMLKSLILYQSVIVMRCFSVFMISMHCISRRI